MRQKRLDRMPLRELTVMTFKGNKKGYKKSQMGWIRWKLVSQAKHLSLNGTTKDQIPMAIQENVYLN